MKIKNILEGDSYLLLTADLNPFHAVHDMSGLELLDPVDWIYLVFENVTQRNVFCPISSVKTFL
jgi:hypothetical protein